MEVQGTVLLMVRTQVLKSASRMLAAPHPSTGPRPSGPSACYQVLLVRKAGRPWGPTLHEAYSSHPHPDAYLGLSWYQARGR